MDRHSRCREDGSSAAHSFVRPQSERRGCPISNPRRPAIFNDRSFPRRVFPGRAPRRPLCFAFLVDEKIAPSRRCASHRNEARPDLVINDRSSTNATCVSDSGGLATRSSQNSGTIESDFCNILRVRERKVRDRHISGQTVSPSLELRNRRGPYVRWRQRSYLLGVCDPARIGHLTLGRASHCTDAWSESSFGCGRASASRK